MMSEFLAYSTILSARQNGRRGGLSVFRSLSQECETVVISLVKDGHDVMTILKIVQSQGFTSTKKLGEEKKNSRRIVDRVVRQIKLITPDDELAESNTLNQFAKERIKATAKNTLSGTDIYESYANWCESKCKIPLSIARVGRLLASKFKKEKRLVSGLSHYDGLALRV